MTAFVVYYGAYVGHSVLYKAHRDAGIASMDLRCKITFWRYLICQLGFLYVAAGVIYH